MYTPIQHKLPQFREKKRGSLMAILETDEHWFVLLRDAEGGVGSTVHAVPRNDYEVIPTKEGERGKPTKEGSGGGAVDEFI